MRQRPSRQSTARRSYKRRCTPGRLTWALLAAASLWVWGAPGTARAVEFASPPGIDVARQEQQLKAEVFRNAKDLLGEGLVDVIVHVTYARTETGTAAEGLGQKIKLPGFNRFIRADAGDQLDIKSEFVRMRQIFVVVTDNLGADAESIERELNSQGRFVRAKGDLLKVITLSRSAAVGGPGRPGEPGTGEEEEEKNGRFEPKKRQKKKRVGGPFNEPESTKYLLRARTAYFKEDYNRTLDHILKAIEVEPRSAQAYAMLGSLYFTINWKNLAVKYWEMALELDPDNSELEDLVAEVKNAN